MTATQQPHKPHLTATLILACLAQFMVILDVSVVNVALPSMKHALDFTEDGLQWVVNAYTVTFAGFLLLGGRAADLLGRRRVFVFGLVLFSLASLAGGLADSRTILIVARLVQGLGGAVIAPASLSILTSTFTEPKERHRAVGIWGAMGGAGAAAGVLLGGVITDLLSWRWIFFINLPIGLIAAFLSQRMLLEGRNEHATRNFDVAGALTATLGLSALVYGIVRTDSSGWGNATTLLSIGVGVGLLAIFLVLEGWVAKAPLMPLRLFRSRQLSAANVIIGLVGAVDVRDVVLPLPVSAGSARVLADQDRPGLPADDARDRGRLDSRVADHAPGRSQAPADLRHDPARRSAWRLSPTSASTATTSASCSSPACSPRSDCRSPSSPRRSPRPRASNAAGGRAGLGCGQHRAAVRRRARIGDPRDGRDLPLQQRAPPSDRCGPHRQRRRLSVASSSHSGWPRRSPPPA